MAKLKKSESVKITREKKAAKDIREELPEVLSAPEIPPKEEYFEVPEVKPEVEIPIEEVPERQPEPEEEAEEIKEAIESLKTPEEPVEKGAAGKESPELKVKIEKFVKLAERKGIEEMIRSAKKEGNFYVLNALCNRLRQNEEYKKYVK